MCKRGHICFDCLSRSHFFLSMEMKPFDPGRGSPKTENVSSCTTFLLPLNIQLLRKGSHAEGILFILPCSLSLSPPNVPEKNLDVVFLPRSPWTVVPSLHSTSFLFCLIYPPLPPAAWREEPRSCIASSYLPSVFAGRHRRVPKHCMNPKNNPG